MPPIVIRNLNHYFGKGSLSKQVLFDINLEIKAGEIIIMTGQSGSGKTTLLSLIGALRSVQKGSLRVLEQELLGGNEDQMVWVRRRIGYIFQAHNLLQFMTARQNVQMSVELMHRSGVDIGQELYGAIARFDHQTKTLIQADFGDNRYPMKAIYAVDAENPEKGWVLTVVFDGNSCSSSVWIFEQEHLDAEPVCRLALPSVVSFGFGGTWKSA